jgi:hypothetical protein
MNVIGFLLLLVLMCIVFLFTLALAIKPSGKRYGYHGGGATELPTNTKEKNPFLQKIEKGEK